MDNEAAYVLDEDADEIIDICADDINNIAADDDADDNADDLGMTTGELDAMNLMASSSNEMDEMSLQNDAAVTFTNHSGSVFCVSVSSRMSLAVSGSEDDVAYVWNVTNGDPVFSCTGHKDSVTCVCFNHDSKLIVTGDMSGLVIIWSVESGQQVCSYEVDELEWLRWHHSSNVLLAGTKSGDTWMWLVPSTTCKTFAGHGARSTAAVILHDGRRLCVGYADGTVKLLDLKSGVSVFSLAAGKSGHDDEVTCVDCHHNDNLIITGSVDCTALLINVGTGKVVQRLVCGERSHRQTNDNDDDDDGDSEADVDSVEAVGFSSSHDYVATATHLGVLTIWETSSLSARHQCQHSAGVIRLRWDPHRPMVFTCTEAGAVCLWDARNGQLVCTWLGHSGNILDMDVTSEWVVTAGDDHTARVFSLQPSQADPTDTPLLH